MVKELGAGAMNVDAVGTQEWSYERQDRNAEQVVQDVFSEVLAAAGREGYASAEAIPDDRPLADHIASSWSDWFDGESRHGRYQNEPNGEELKLAYGEILVRAHEEGGHADPHAFLKKLSEDELAVVQQVHRLADPINVDELTVEGAVNLLVPPAAQIDLNRDGLTRCGVAYGLRFPDSNTPPEVVTAWEEATAGMSFEDRMIYEFQMTLPLLTANIVVDDQGHFVRRYEPGDPEFTNPMASSEYSYVQAAQDRLDYLELFKTRMSPEQYERDMAFWTRMHELLGEHGAI